MNPTLGQFQDDFVDALFAPIGDMPSVLASQAGFSVYRNTVMKGCIDALQANYPAVTRLVGEEWMRGAAAIYVRAYPPQDPRLFYYGESFADFLAGFEPAAGLPYLADVARLDRFWAESHAAADDASLDADALSRVAPGELASMVLQPHTSARWAWFGSGPIYSIWRRNREAVDDDSEIEWQGEGALLVRPHGTVQWMALDAAGCAFLDACRSGLPLAQAAAAALEVQRDADIASLLARLLEAGAYQDR